MKKLNLTKEQFRKLHPTEFYILSYLIESPRFTLEKASKEMNYVGKTTLDKYLVSMQKLGYVEFLSKPKSKYRHIKVKIDMYNDILKDK